MRIVSTLNFIPDRSRPGLTTTAIGTVDLQGAGGNWATVGRRSIGGRRVHRQRQKRKGKSVGLRIGTLNVGTMTGKGRELADMMERRKVDILCVQETRWKGSKAHSIGAGFKLFYYGVDSKRNDVGVVLKEEFVRNVLEVKRVSDRVMSLKLEIEGVMLNVVSGYAPQVGCELEEKERFWSELDEVMESIPTGERVVIGADFNGHVGEGNTGYEEVMGKFGVKERNLEGQMVVDFAKRIDMAVVNTYFQKREEHGVTYKSGGRRTQIEKKTKWWKLKKEECCEEFRQKLRQALGGQVVLPDDWETTAEVIRETGRKVLGVSSGRRKEDKETWWWNEEVQDSIQRKRLAKKKWDMDRTEENRQEYKELQRRVKREVSKAKQKAYDELYTRLDTREGEKDLYRLARQRDRDGKDVQQVRVIKDRDGRVLTSEESVQRRWKEYFEELMNEENEREKRVEGVNSVEQKVEKIRKDEVRKALKRMKSGKAVGPDDIPVEVWKCLGEAAVEFLTSLFNRVLESERMPEEWRRSVLGSIFKNKDLEKAYDRVPREELWYCMRKSGVAEKYVRVVQDMYERSRTVVRCAVDQTEEFKVEVGLHQGSALSPFLFAIVMDQLSEEVRQESPWTMMFADDIVICSESSTNFIPDRSRPGLTTTAIGAVDLQGADGNWATVGRRSRGGRRVRRQREKRKGKSVGLRIGTLNVGTMTGKGRELADVMERRKVDILCVQETRWKGSKAHSIGAGFKLFYYGVDSKRNGVGVVLKEEFVRNVLEVKRVSDRVMTLKLEIEGVMLNVVSGYAPQVGCELEEKERFWSELDEVMESIPTGERVVIGADFNGHVGEGNTGYEEVMGKFGVKERNLEGQTVVDFAKRMDMAVVNTYFQKREEHGVTYKSGGRRTQKKRSKIGIEKKTKWWKLKKEECCEEFRQKLRQALGGQVVLPDDWETTAEVIRETGRKVLGVSSGRRKEDKETWWWNEEVQDSIQRKRLAKKKWDMDRTEENRQEYKELQRRVKREVSKAKQKAYDELYTRLDTREGEKDLYRLARQRDRDGKDVQQKVEKIRKDEVRKALKRMKSGKAVGPDDIPVEVWKCLREAAVEFLISLFNRVLENLEKAYDRVPREKLWYCMRKLGVAEKYVRVVQDMYERSRTVVRCAVVMDQLSEEVRQESPWTMMFADDIVICSESREQVEENLERWRFALERRGMKVTRIQSNGECGKEKISARIKGKVYRTVVRPAMLYGLETVSLRKRQESELEVAELKMLRFSLGVTRLDRIRNEYIRGTAHVGGLGDKVREARLRWFGHVQRREMGASVEDAEDRDRWREMIRCGDP
ncbi:hypothetical protein QTP70_004955 [Hemibagrus guttatus]|uniref:Reverse transcriptase domain-containing protein n=1 Tax=Hemibagrus guttatus TaxID=175788 RepID=A0AAE0UTG1_9TELE|nr:hypothetical protein QTP70_004955 [Hemibagrus guttatus]